MLSAQARASHYLAHLIKIQRDPKPTCHRGVSHVIKCTDAVGHRFGHARGVVGQIDNA
jgi:hypothetical protein